MQSASMIVNETFMPQNGTEKDTKKICGKMKVSRTTSSVKSHDVTNVDSTLDGFRFYGGRWFPVHAGANNNVNQTTSATTTTNLRTFEDGFVDAGNTCWSPNIRGPNEEPWTVDGDIRNTNLSVSNNFTSWSFDGRPATAGNLQIPKMVATMEDTYEDAAPDRQFLSMGRYQSLIPDSSANHSPMQSYQCRGVDISTHEPTTPFPNASPFVNSKAHEGVTTRNAMKRPSRTVGQTFRMSNGRRRYKRPQPNLTPPTISKPYHHHRHARRLSIDTDISFDDGPVFIEELKFMSSRCSRKSSVLPPMHRSPCSPNSEPVHWDDDVDSCSLTLREISRALYGRSRKGELITPASSFIDNHFGNTLDSISERWTQENTDPNGRPGAINNTRNANLCDMEDPNCTYSALYTSKHYHSPADKCLSNTHEHCVSRLRALPGEFGDCILMSMPSRLHQCCYWEDKDREDWPPKLRQEFDDRKLREAREKGLQVYDMSRGVKWECPPVDMRVYGELGVMVQYLEDVIAQGKEKLELDISLDVD